MERGSVQEIDGFIVRKNEFGDIVSVLSKEEDAVFSSRLKNGDGTTYKLHFDSKGDITSADPFAFDDDDDIGPDKTIFHFDRAENDFVPVRPEKSEYFEFYDDEVVFIPEGVEVLEKYALLNFVNMKKLVLPKSLYYIRRGAFAGCVNLEEVIFSEGLQEIEEGAFKDCKSLKVFHAPKSLKEVGSAVCEGCESLEEATFEDGTKFDNLGISFFKDCKKLTKVRLPQDLKQLPSEFFSGCESLPETYLPDSVQEIGANAYCGCISLKHIDIDVSTMQDCAFKDCTGLETARVMGISHVSMGVFCGCVNLRSAELDDEVFTIGRVSFQGCKSLSGFKLGKNVMKVGAMAFSGAGLKEINIPMDLSEVGNCAFDMPNLQRFVIEEENKSFFSPDGVGLYSWKTLELIQYAAGYPSEDYTVEDGITGIGYSAFKDAKNLKHLTVSSAVDTYKINAFEGADNLKLLTIAKEDAFSLVAIKMDFAANYPCPNAKFEKVEIKGNIIGFNTIYLSKLTNLKEVEFPTLHEGRTYNITGVLDKKSLNGVRFIIPKNCDFVSEESFGDGTILDFGEDGCYYGSDLFAAKRYSVDESGLLFKEKWLGFPLTTLLVMFKSGEHRFRQGSEERLFDTKKIPFFRVLGGTDGSSEAQAVFMCHNYSQFLKNNGVKGMPCRNGFIIKAVSGLPEEYKEKFFANFDTNVKKALDCISMKDERSLSKPNSTEDDNTLKDATISAGTSDALKFFAAMGLFENDPITRQRVANFIIDKFIPEFYNPNPQKEQDAADEQLEEKIDEVVEKADHIGNRFRYDLLEKIHAMFNGLNRPEKFQPRLVKFVMKNWQEICKEEKQGLGSFLTRLINNFERIQKCTTSNRGEQREKEVTIEKVLHYFATRTFNGVTKENEPLTLLLSKYFTEDQAFEQGLIFCEDSLKVPRNMFAPIVKVVRRKLKVYRHFDNSPEHDLKEAEGQFRYEWLTKQDFRNLILGKLVNCCASVTCAGSGLVAAAMTHEDFQNLVVYNQDNQIVLKGLFYIDRENGTAVCNSPIFCYDLSREDAMGAFNAFMRGVKDMKAAYNENYPTNPLGQVNTGTNIRYDFISRALTPSKPLPIPDLSDTFKNKYNIGNWHGDANSQSVLMKADQKDVEPIK